MEISIGSKIYLNREFIRKFELDPKASKSFQVIAMTDVAVGVKNVRSGRTYTLALSKVAENMEPAPSVSIPKGRRTAQINQPTPPVEEPTPPVEEPEPPTEGFIHTAPISTGGIQIKRINAITQVEADDDPFGGLYT